MEQKIVTYIEHLSTLILSETEVFLKRSVSSSDKLFYFEDAFEYSLLHNGSMLSELPPLYIEMIYKSPQYKALKDKYKDRVKKIN